MRKLFFVLISTLSLFVIACDNFEDIREIDQVNYSPEFAIPLINSSLSLEEMLEEADELSFLEIAEDGSMSIAYTAETVETQAEELLENPDDFPVALIDSFTSVPVQLFDNFSIQKLVLKNGTLSFDIQSNHTEDIDLTISFPGMMRNGQAFEVQTALTYQGSTPVSASIAPQALEGFELNLSNGELDIRYEAYNTNGDRVLLDVITGQASNWEYENIQGVWENESFDFISDSLEVSLYEDWVDGQVNFEDPKLIINVENSFGFPTQISIQNLIAYDAEGNGFPITSTLSDGHDLNFPSMNEMGESISDQIILDKNNSNIISVFNTRPVMIKYEAIGTINPESHDETGFVTSNSQISADAQIDLPLYGTASGFTLEEDSDFEMDDFEDIDYAEFKMITSNEIPAQLEMQYYFLDDYDNIIDSLFNGQRSLIAAPEVAANGEITAPGEQTDIIEVSAEFLDRIHLASKIRLSAAFSTSNDGMNPVRINSNQKLGIRMGAKLGVNPE